MFTKFLILNCFVISNCFAQLYNPKLNRAIKQAKFSKIERILKKEIKKHKKGKHVINNNGTYTSHQDTPLLLVKWLKLHSNITEAISDDCENKISIYPGWFRLGVLFNTNKGMIEKTISVQTGKTGNVSFFNNRFHLLPSKNVLVYKNMKTTNGFITQQKLNCALSNQEPKVDTISIKK